MKHTISAIIFTAATGLLSVSAAETSSDIATLVKNASHNKVDVAAIVSKEVLARPDLACQIVKGAIVGSNADAASVAAIVEAAMIAAPEQMTAIPRSALVIAPDSSEEISTVIRKYVDVATSTDDSDNNPLDKPTGPPAMRKGIIAGAEKPGEGSGTAGPDGLAGLVDGDNGGSGAANSNMGNNPPMSGIGSIIIPSVSGVQIP